MQNRPLETLSDIDHLSEKSINMVADLLQESDKVRSRRDEANRKRFARLLKDPAAISLTMSLTDEVMRMSSMRSAAKTLRKVSVTASPVGLGIWDFLGLKLISVVSYLSPKLIMKIVHQRVRMAATGIILPAEENLLSRHIRKRNIDKARLNINVLGEAVLGNHEATERLDSVIAMVKRPEVNYASVKISSIASQLITIDHLGSVERVAARLRLLYTQALKENTFINLDMEEFRDLEITVAVFKKLLSEKEFFSMSAGIVLQAYLPESHAVFADLVRWACERKNSGGAAIKIRLVKGANLAMEKAEAELHGWVAAPYASKSDVDASYARLIDTALRPEHADAVRIGLASHNLFHVAFAIEVAKQRGVLHQLDIEMLEGMANAEALAIVGKVGSVLLYTPVTKHDDFPAAVAYLVRRLDENTSLENYLRASFEMSFGNDRYREQAERFQNSIVERHKISTLSRRHGLRRDDPHADFEKGIFLNERDGDATNPEFRDQLQNAWRDLFDKQEMEIPLVINGQEVRSSETEVGTDPGKNGEVWYRYNVADINSVDLATASARQVQQEWENCGAKARAEILERAAQLMETERALSIAVMARDAGKTVFEADPEVSEAIDFARFYALSCIEKENGSQAAGVVLVVPPWNFPYAIPIGGVCAALAAGNAVILKSAPETVATAWHFVQQLWRAGVPKSVLQFVSTRDDEVGRHLVTHDDVTIVILTGAFDTALMFTSWKPSLALMAETSGKNAIVISASADIDSAVKDLVQSAFGHGGQKCSAASLGIVETSIYDNPSFIKQLADAVTSLQVGAGSQYSTTMGPVIRPPSGSLLRALTTLDLGESWLVKPQQLDTSGHLWSPGVKLGITPGSWSHRNEWFGPVLGIMKAPDLNTAIAWQNDVDYGLTAGIHSLDEQECELWISQVQAGNLYVNRGITGAVVNRQPFGGWKRSSVGRSAKAGGNNYLNNLRKWQPLVSVEESLSSARKWWDSTGCKAIDRSGLLVERNYQRYLPSIRGIAIRVDEKTPRDHIAFISEIASMTGTHISWSSASDAPFSPQGINESIDAFVLRVSGIDKVRWLSDEAPPKLALLEKGISLDSSPLAARGDIEMPRWLLEQSIAITNHRYGNVGAGPRPQIN